MALNKKSLCTVDSTASMDHSWAIINSDFDQEFNDLGMPLDTLVSTTSTPNTLPSSRLTENDINNPLQLQELQAVYNSDSDSISILHESDADSVTVNDHPVNSYPIVPPSSTKRQQCPPRRRRTSHCRNGQNGQPSTLQSNRHVLLHHQYQLYRTLLEDTDDDSDDDYVHLSAPNPTRRNWWQQMLFSSSAIFNSDVSSDDYGDFVADCVRCSDNDDNEISSSTESDIDAEDILTETLLQDMPCVLRQHNQNRLLQRQYKRQRRSLRKCTSFLTHTVLVLVLAIVMLKVQHFCINRSHYEAMLRAEEAAAATTPTRNQSIGNNNHTKFSQKSTDTIDAAVKLQELKVLEAQLTLKQQTLIKRENHLIRREEEFMENWRKFNLGTLSMERKRIKTKHSSDKKSKKHDKKSTVCTNEKCKNGKKNNKYRYYKNISQNNDDLENELKETLNYWYDKWHQGRSTVRNKGMISSSDHHDVIEGAGIANNRPSPKMKRKRY